MYTDEQYSMMEFFEAGAIWTWHKDPSKDEIVMFLDKEDLVKPREYIKPGYRITTEKGKAELHRHRKSIAESEKRDNIMAEQIAENKRQNRTANTLQVIVPIITFFLGYAADHIPEIAMFIKRIISNIGSVFH